MKRFLPFLIGFILLVLILAGISTIFRLRPIKEYAQTPTPQVQPNVLENFQPDFKPSRNSGTWAKRMGYVSAERVSPAPPETVLRLSFDMREDSVKFKEAGFWESLSGMDMSRYSELRFRVALSNPATIFLIGFKSGDWLEQKIWSENYTKRSVPAGQWQQVVIPLRDFHKIKSWVAMDNISITFRTNVGNVHQGEIFLDDFVLVPGPRMEIKKPLPIPKPYPLPDKPYTLPDDKLLDAVQRAAFGYFWAETNPLNGLIKDFCLVRSDDQIPVASSAAVGFGLSGLCVAASRGWIPDAIAQKRILTTLKFYRDDAEQEHGFFYHFLDMETGRRWEESELSSVDTALLLAGMLHAGRQYAGTEIQSLAQEIYERVDWRWMMNGKKTLCMGWTPEDGFLNAHWDGYCELMIIYLLAIGSPTHPIPAGSWYEWARLENMYEGEKFIACPPLFTHQYSQLWVDFRGMKDKDADYFENSAAATRANMKWSQKRQDKFRTFKEGFWGLTASDGPAGYMAYGAPYGVDDGTVAPTAAISSIVFAPKESLAMIRLMLEKMQPEVWGRYGFIDAFNLEKEWFSNKYIGIDQGPIVLMIENYRSGQVWKTFMKVPEIQKALNAVGFEKTEAPAADQTSNK